MSTILTPHQIHDHPGPIRLIDVRTPAEFEAVHIEGARLIPLDRLDASQARSSPGEHCVLVCHSGKRAAQACEKLSAAGCGNLAVLEGGVAAWEAAGLPVKRGRQTLSLERQVRIAAGSLVLTGVVLGAGVHPAFYGLSAFVGAGLVFAGLTDWCGMALLLAKMPWNQRPGVSCQNHSR